MKLLISPINKTEAQEASTGGADIIDIKNPKEGSLGANYPWIIKQIQQTLPKNIEVSCTIGDLPNLPGTAALTALGAASLKVNYIKVGLQKLNTPNEAIFLIKQICRAAKDFNPKIKVVVAGYGDAKKIGTLNPLLIPKITHKANADIAMLDTAIKDGTPLTDHLTSKQLQLFINSTHDLGLQAALAGSLRKQDLPTVYNLGADIVGLRGAACTGNDRNKGNITKIRVAELCDILKQCKISQNYPKTNKNP
ncbi:MAG: hypothetical protein LBQ98_03790 [Nitrososphaerota archaeon]|nr:hypothetical protein [Nitrososphaerota archaeon]